MCVSCELLSFELGRKKAEIADLKAQLSKQMETLSFYKLLPIRECDVAGIYFKEVVYAEKGVAVPAPDSSATSKGLI